MVMISSFDVFDTVLTRKVGTPKSSFLLLGRKLRQLSLINCTGEAFSLIRADAEWRAFEKAGGFDSGVSLDTIYQEVGYALRLSQEQVQELQELEKKLEIELITPIPKAAELISDARKKGHQIVFVSDMYMGADFIRDRLSAFNLIEECDRLYVSKDYKKSKHTGSLYRQIVSQENIAKSNIIHCGSHPLSDVRAARKVGLQVNPFLEGSLNRYEQIMEAFALHSEGLSVAMAGASRLARLAAGSSSDHENALRAVAAGVAAPWLTGFTLWILQRAQALGINRLYFLARDGQLIIEIAERLIKKLGLDLEVFYLYGSRQAWLLPSLTTLDKEKISWIFNLEVEVDHLSPRILFARFAISPDEIESSLEEFGIFSRDWDRNLNADERKKLCDYLISNPEIQQLILMRASEKRGVLLQYLEQVELLKDDNFGIVDLGTGATLHNALAAILESRGLEPPKSFYLGLRNIPASKYGHPEHYMYDKRSNLGFNKAPGLVTILEAVCSADHGSVVDYAVQGELVQPILKEESNQVILDWGHLTVRNAVLTFTDYLLLDPSLLNVWGDVRPMCEVLQKTFWLSPTVDEARAWGSFPMEDGWGKESEILVLATAYSVTDLPRLAWHLIRDGKIRSWRRHWWHNAAIKMSRPWVQLVFNSASRVVQFSRKIRLKLRKR